MAYFPTVSTQKNNIKDGAYVAKDACKDARAKSYSFRGLGGFVGTFFFRMFGAGLVSVLGAGFFVSVEPRQGGFFGVSLVAGYFASPPVQSSLVIDDRASLL